MRTPASTSRRATKNSPTPRGQRSRCGPALARSEWIVSTGPRRDEQLQRRSRCTSSLAACASARRAKDSNRCNNVSFACRSGTKHRPRPGPADETPHPGNCCCPTRRSASGPRHPRRVIRSSWLKQLGHEPAASGRSGKAAPDRRPSDRNAAEDSRSASRISHLVRARQFNDRGQRDSRVRRRVYSNSEPIDGHSEAPSADC